MNSFYLNCWVPSLKNYFKLAELKMYQLEVLTKYMLNEDNENINSVFNEIVLENLVQKEIYSKLTKFDKWFILTFLRASSISSMLHYNLKDQQNNPCLASFSLFDTLTNLSEIGMDEIPTLELDDLKIEFKTSKDLYTENYIFENIFRVYMNNKKYYPKAFSTDKKIRFFNSIPVDVVNELKEHLEKYRSLYNTLHILKNDKNLKEFYSVRFDIIDNTLFDFLKAIFIPYAQNFYKKKYFLLSKLGIDLNSINNLTPFECDIYLNNFNSEKEAVTL